MISVYLKTISTKYTTHFYIIESYRKPNGKTSTRTYKKLGNIDEVTAMAGDVDPFVWAEQQAKYYTEIENEDKKEFTITLSNSKTLSKNIPINFNVGYLHLQKIYNQLNIPKLINDITVQTKIEYNLTNIFADLIYGRILFPASKKSTFEETKNLLKRQSYDIQHVYRGLDILAKNSDVIQETLYKNSNKIIDRDTQVLYYDCTNFYFEIEEADELRKYGKSKENRPNPIIQMGLFLDGSGIPLAFDITPGNTNEQTTLRPLERKVIRDFELSDVIVCTDAGLSSIANKKFNDIGNRKYVTVQSLKKLKGHLKEWALNPEGWSTKGSDKLININDLTQDNLHQIYYKERWITENGIEERLVISYSLKYANYQSSIREKQVNRAINKIESNQSINKSSNPNDVRRFINVINTTDHGEVSDNSVLSLNENQINKEKMYDGFYGIVTNLESSLDEIIKINKGRWEIEESFRIMKTDLKSRPVYLTNESRIKAHFLSCFVSLLILRILEKQLEYKYTTNDIIKTLRTQTVVDIKGIGYIPSYTRTNLTDHLDMLSKTELNTEIIDRNMMKKNKRNTKI